MVTEAPPTPAPPVTEKRRKPRLIVGLGILVVVVTAYALSLVGVHLLSRSEGPLPPLDLSSAGPDDTVVQVRLDELKPVNNRLTVNVLVYPGESLLDKRFDVLTTDIAVRLYPPNDLGDIVFPKGKTPAQASTTIEAHGDRATGRSTPTGPRRCRPMCSSGPLTTGNEYPPRSW
jgi:hypothetical protein